MSYRSSTLRALAVLLLAACGDTRGTGPEGIGRHRCRAGLRHGHPVPSGTGSTSCGPGWRRFRRFQVAEEAGWSAQITECMADPAQGGMGCPLREPRPDQQRRRGELPRAAAVRAAGRRQAGSLVAVEYIVPFDQWHHSRPPRLLGQDFKRNETFQLWGLHIWLWRHNPTGRFADWNPHVHCN